MKAARDFKKIEDIAKASLAVIDENLPFIIKCDALEVAVLATLDQCGRPVTFMSRTLHVSECHYLAIEKEAMVIIEAVRKRKYFLA